MREALRDGHVVASGVPVADVVRHGVAGVNVVRVAHVRDVPRVHNLHVHRAVVGVVRDGDANHLEIHVLHDDEDPPFFKLRGRETRVAVRFAHHKAVRVVNRVAAKRRVFGKVGIDMIAGPSEILIICDGTTNPDWIAMDLFSQAEHDEDAQAILLCPDKDFISQVEESIKKLLPSMDREEIIRTSLKNRGALILTKDISEAIQISNSIAPEHLELSVKDPEGIVDLIKHAGAIFMGKYSSEALGDYCAGTNHVLPTSGTARFSSPLGVYDFTKRSSIIMASKDGANKLGKTASTLAYGEGLQAHALSALYRTDKE